MHTTNPTRITIPNDIATISTIDDIAGDYAGDYDIPAILEDLPDALDAALAPYGIHCDLFDIWTYDTEAYPDSNALDDALRDGDPSTAVEDTLNVVMRAHDVSHRG